MKQIKKQHEASTFEERYQENLRRQARDIFRSWGWVEKPDGTWGEPKRRKVSNTKPRTINVYVTPEPRKTIHIKARLEKS